VSAADQALPNARVCSRASQRALLGFVGVWLLAVTSGFALVGRYELTPGRVGDTPQRQPAELTRTLTEGRPLLLMLAHPHCPCTRASVVELEKVISHRSASLQVIVAFVLPEGADDTWGTTALRKQTSEIRGVTVMTDDRGALSRLLGASTSGHTFYYDAEGALRFSGGITPARGETGECAGNASLTGLLSASTSATSRSIPAKRVWAAIRCPVYGCPLLNDSAEAAECSTGKGNSCHH